MATGSDDGHGSGERGIFRRLKDEHAAIAAMMRRAAGTTSAEARRGLFEEVRRELLAHAASEERELYPVLRRLDETSDLVDESVEDHGAIEQMLEQLRAMDFDSDDWADLFEETMLEVHDHVDQEENELFPLAEELLEPAEAARIDERYAAAKQQALRRVA